jgi:hypothetical protein
VRALPAALLGAAALSVAALGAWRFADPAPGGRAVPGARGAPAALPARDRASREADAIVEASRRGRHAAALAGLHDFLRVFEAADLDDGRRPGLEEARLVSGRWGLAESLALAKGGEPEAAEVLLARAMLALDGTAGAAEAAAAAAEVRLLVEKAAGAAASRARASALAPADAAVAAARAEGVARPEKALDGLLAVLQSTTDPDARRRIEAEVGVLRKRVAAKGDRAERRRAADRAIQAGDYARARKILEGLVEGAAGAGVDPSEAAADRAKLEGIGDLEGNREPEALAACRKALRWMVKQQIPDGSFTVPVLGDDGKVVPDEERKKGRNRVGLTGLAALALLGHVRYDLADEFAADLDEALAWLAAAQKKDGSFGGGMYEHAIATLALVEADRLLHRKGMAEPGRKALAWLQAAQGTDGGWRYTPRAPLSDVSVTGWALQAILHADLGEFDVTEEEIAAAERAGQPPRERLRVSAERALAYLDRMTDPLTGRVGYTVPGQGSYAMTAASVFCRLRMGQGPDDERVRQGAAVLLRTLPAKGWSESAYGLFYASDATSRLGGDSWRKWAPALKKYLLDSQVKEGDAAGAWPSKDDRWGREAGAGPIFMVALHALCLENFFENRE